MPVGEGSIKRAAGKAEGSRKKSEEEKEVSLEQGTGKSKKKSLAAGAQNASAGKERKSAGTESASAGKERKSAGTESASAGKEKESGRRTNGAAGRKKPVKTENAETEKGYEAYGIGQPLPTYLL